MSYIKADISNFTGHYAKLNQVGKLIPTSRFQLAHAAMTVGQQGMIATSQLGFFRLIQLLSTIFANVEQSNNSLCIHNRYYKLDKSEKDTVSFLLGMAVTKHIASELLNVPWLIHVSKYQHIQLVNTNKQVRSKLQLYSNQKIPKAPDLLGFDSSGNCHIFEAKGSCSQKLNTSTLQHAIDQVSQVQSVNGKTPSTLVACFAHCLTTGINAKIIDPEPPKSGVAYEYNLDQIIRDYYNQYDQMFGTSNSKRTFGNIEYLIRPLGVPNLYFGIRNDFLKIARESESYKRITSLVHDSSIKSNFFEQDAEISASKDGTILFGSLPRNNGALI